MPDFEMHDLDPCPMPSTLQAPANRGLQPQPQRWCAGTAAGLIATILGMTDEGANEIYLRTTGPLTPRKLFILIRSSLLVRIVAALGEAVASDGASVWDGALVWVLHLGLALK